MPDRQRVLEPRSAGLDSVLDRLPAELSRDNASGRSRSRDVRSPQAFLLDERCPGWTDARIELRGELLALHGPSCAMIYVTHDRPKR